MSVALFAGAYYYPDPGWRAFVGRFDSVQAAQAHLDTCAQLNAGRGIDRKPMMPLADGEDADPLDWAQIVENDLIVATWDDDGWTPHPLKIGGNRSV